VIPRSSRSGVSLNGGDSYHSKGGGARAGASTESAMSYLQNFLYVPTHTLLGLR
jgi:hypothetical protein